MAMLLLSLLSNSFIIALTFLAWYRHFNKNWRAEASCIDPDPQALVSFKKYMSHPLPYFKVNICPLPLPHFASIFFAYL
jgi:hypothetical protein